MLMTNGSVCCIRKNQAISHAAVFLQSRGIPVSYYPTRSTRYLLLPIPSFPKGTDYLKELLPEVSANAVIAGGNLDTPLLVQRKTIDFLKDPYYLAGNAAITAGCTMNIIRQRHNPEGASMLILGWGRIGKCLAKLAFSEGATVTVAARKETDLAMISALGFLCLPIGCLTDDLQNFDIIVNTVPAMILPNMNTKPDAVAIELASMPGMAGENIISALGLPGKMAPEASGKLIAETFLRLSKEESS